jgi:DNA adenine methylase
MNDKLLPRPFIKWAGGKTQLADALSNRLPFKFVNYHEPFLGGGAFFFKLYREGKFERARVSDLNSELIDTYCAIRDSLEDVIKELSQYPHNEEFYYQLRAKNPLELSLPARAARMIYLNKTGYNGLYRVNRSGGFNVPFGKYKNPKYLDKDNLQAVSHALQKVDIHNASFETVLDYAKEGDLVYFDPPYVPVSPTANFTSYQANGFSVNDQRKLRDVCIELTRRNVYVILSNSDTEIVRDLFSPYSFEVNEVLANRAINCNGSRRGKMTELIITNYSTERATQLQLLENRSLFTVAVP